jgi:hypothetical protein
VATAASVIVLAAVLGLVAISTFALWLTLRVTG